MFAIDLQVGEFIGNGGDLHRTGPGEGNAVHASEAIQEDAGKVLQVAERTGPFEKHDGEIVRE